MERTSQNISKSSTHHSMSTALCLWSLSVWMNWTLGGLLWVMNIQFWFAAIQNITNLFMPAWLSLKFILLIYGIIFHSEHRFLRLVSMSIALKMMSTEVLLLFQWEIHALWTIIHSFLLHSTQMNDHCFNLMYFLDCSSSWLYCGLCCHLGRWTVSGSLCLMTIFLHFFPSLSTWAAYTLPLLVLSYFSWSQTSLLPSMITTIIPRYSCAARIINRSARYPCPDCPDQIHPIDEMC